MVTLETAILAYKGYIGILPDNLQKKYKIHEESSYNFRKIKKLIENRVQNRLQSMCPSYKGIKTFNDLPDNIANAKSVLSFKRQLKLLLLNGY